MAKMRQQEQSRGEITTPANELATSSLSDLSTLLPNPEDSLRDRTLPSIPNKPQHHKGPSEALESLLVAFMSFAQAYPDHAEEAADKAQKATDECRRIALQTQSAEQRRDLTTAQAAEFTGMTKRRMAQLPTELGFGKRING